MMARAHLAETPFYVEETTLRTPDAVLAGSLTVPAKALGMIAFAHGSGSSRFSPRNRAVEMFLNEARLGTLLLDLLPVKERRIDDVTAHLPLGLFGASTGAAAALCAADERGQAVAVRLDGKPAIRRTHGRGLCGLSPLGGGAAGDGLHFVTICFN